LAAEANVDRWKATALLAVGMLAGQLWASACNGAKTGADTAWAEPSGATGVVPTGSGPSITTTASGGFGRAVFSLAKKAYHDAAEDCIRRADPDSCCPSGFSAVGIHFPGPGAGEVICLED
jgi:hypothetical protein